MTSGSSRLWLPASLYLLHPCSRMQAMILTGPPQLLQVSMSMLNARFRRCAQVIAMDGMYAGFAGAKTGHGGPPFGGRGVFHRIRHASFVALAALGRRHLCTMRAVGGEHTMESSQVDPGLRHQRDKPGDEVQRLENDVRGAITVRRLELVTHVAIGRERQGAPAAAGHSLPEYGSLGFD